MKIQKLKNGQHFITLPIQLVNAKGWKKGDELKFIIDEYGQLTLIKKEVIYNSKN